MKNITMSRRDFLRSAAVSTAAIAAMSAFAGCSGSSSTTSSSAAASSAAETTAAATTAAAGKSVEISLGHALSEGTPACEEIKAWAERVAEKTEGRVVIDIFPNSQLGSETDMLEQMQLKTLESAAIMCGTMQSLDMKMAIEDLPYMWKDAAAARKAFDGEFGAYLADIMAGQGMQKIGYAEWGFRHITNNIRPIVEPEDMKGMKIRVAQTKLRVDTFEQIGALPQSMAFSELYGALQQGVVDAQENPLANIVAANFDEVQKYLSLTGHFYNTVMMIMDQDIWASISEADQKIMLDEEVTMSENIRTQNDDKEGEYIQTLKDRGMEVNDDVDKDAFKEAMSPVYDKWESEVFGEDLMNVYRSLSGYEA